MSRVFRVDTEGRAVRIFRIGGTARRSRTWTINRDAGNRDAGNPAIVPDSDQRHEFLLDRPEGGTMRFRVPAHRFSTLHGDRVEVFTASLPGHDGAPLLMRNLSSGLEYDLSHDAWQVVGPLHRLHRRAAWLLAVAGPVAGFMTLDALSPLALAAGPLASAALAGYVRLRRRAAAAAVQASLEAADQPLDAETEGRYEAAAEARPMHEDKPFGLTEDEWQFFTAEAEDVADAEFEEVTGDVDVLVVESRSILALEGPRRALRVLRPGTPPARVATRPPPVPVPAFLEVRDGVYHGDGGIEIAVQRGCVLFCTVPGVEPVGLLFEVAGGALHIKGGKLKDLTQGIRDLTVREKAQLSPIVEGYARSVGTGLRLPPSWVAAVKEHEEAAAVIAA